MTTKPFFLEVNDAQVSEHKQTSAGANHRFGGSCRWIALVLAGNPRVPSILDSHLPQELHSPGSTKRSVE